jgi:hypothetical protein
MQVCPGAWNFDKCAPTKLTEGQQVTQADAVSGTYDYYVFDVEYPEDSIRILTDGVSVTVYASQKYDEPRSNRFTWGGKPIVDIDGNSAAAGPLYISVHNKVSMKYTIEVQSPIHSK